MREVLKKACLAGGSVMEEFVSSSYQTAIKQNDMSLVTEADKASEKAIIDIITEAFPSHCILSEESGQNQSHDENNYRWIVDPIDGTTNFFHQNPLCGVSIAIEHQNRIIMGGIYNPFMKEFYFGEVNKGAFLNDKAFQIPTTNIPLNQITAVLYNSDKFYGNTETYQPIYEKLMTQKVHSRKTGASAIDLCWVATGRIHAFISAYHINAWDIAAGIIILQEAGAKIADFSGKTFRLENNKNIIAGNPAFINHFLTHII